MAKTAPGPLLWKTRLPEKRSCVSTTNESLSVLSMLAVQALMAISALKTQFRDTLSHLRSMTRRAQLPCSYVSQQYKYVTSSSLPCVVLTRVVQGSRGSADTVRDARGFAVKFYTDEGNWD